ncbi:DUF2889 domain-containing protein [Mycobacterium seoulense]|uniref:DUF2889 domain-containing protein n=2 Tax=Mycobacterium TaxID=1763 RepID=A0A7I7P0W2_9MYCO|nr:MULTISPECIES: DUF2889 domain-containing protein [Mycobacterium]MCV7437455.1 DUF2889 domain-containing protein [Mycobacterium seoulense]BBY02541.1 hypothetical protein MSEO_30400 [Mycobacterium seoulense]
MSGDDLGTPRFGLHPLHGIHEPTQGTPRLLPGSVRRTSSIDMTRKTGSIDPVYLSGRARDVKTACDGTTTEVGHARLEATVETFARVVQHLEVEPIVANMNLSGAPAMSGFRAAVDKAAPDLRRRRDLRYTLLDDVPVATLISGHALSASGVLGVAAKSGYLPIADRCAGFVTGGLLMTSFEGGDPAVVTGPPAPALEDPADPLAWHAMAPLPVHGMRRRRRLDVQPCSDSSKVSISAMFRDSYVRADSTETIIHEYTLDASVDADTGVILHSQAIPRVLPWQECPGAVASATRITGMRLDELHFRVRQELAGTSTCTHLNDLLRSVADTAALIPLLSTP